MEEAIDPRKGRILNPRFSNLAKTYASLSEKLREASAFLADMVEKTRERFSRMRGNFGYMECREFIHALFETGVTNIIHSQEDMNTHPEAFFMLADNFLVKAEKEHRYRGYHALTMFYRHMYKTGVLTEEFCFRNNSPKTLLAKGRLEEFLRDEYEGSDHTCIVQMRTNYPAIFSLKLRAAFLKEYVVRALSHSRSDWRKSLRSVEIGRDIAAWYDAQGEPLRDFKDMNGARLDAAVKHIFGVYTERKELANAMYFIFDLYQVAMLDHPKHNFFADTFSWNAVLVMDQRLPMNIANGYRIVFAGVDRNLPGYEKVVFCITGQNHKYANDHRYGVRAFNLSAIKSEFYRRIVVNYIATTKHTGMTRLTTVFSYLETRKQGKNLDVIITKDMNGLRRHLSGRGKAENKNSYLRSATAILCWARDEGYLSFDDEAMDDFKWFKTLYRPKPQPLPKDWLCRIKAGLEKLAENDYRAQIALWIFELILFGDSRSGQLCNIDLMNLHYSDVTGTLEYRAIEKNSYREVVTINFSTVQTRILEDAIDMSAAIRAKCPVNGIENNLFIYSCGKYRNNEFKVMSNTTLNQQLQKACKLVGLPKITTGNLRDTYMTSLRRHAHEKGYTDLQTSILTRHRRKVSTNSYVDLDLDSFLKKGNGIYIGNLKRYIKKH